MPGRTVKVKCTACGFSGTIGIETLVARGMDPRVHIESFGRGFFGKQLEGRRTKDKDMALMCMDNMKPFACKLEFWEIIDAGDQLAKG